MHAATPLLRSPQLSLRSSARPPSTERSSLPASHAAPFSSATLSAHLLSTRGAPTSLLLRSSTCALALAGLLSASSVQPALADNSTYQGGSGAEEWSLTLPSAFARDNTVAPRLVAQGSTLGSTPQALDGFGPAPPVNPLKARFFDQAGAVVSIGVRRAAELRPTLLQVNSVADFGTPEEAAAVLAPPGSALKSASTLELEGRTYYRLAFERRGALGCLQTAARSGRVIVALALALPGSEADACSLVASLRIPSPPAE